MIFIFCFCFCWHVSPPSAFLFLPDPQGYIMSGHQMRPRLDTEYNAPLILQPQKASSKPAIRYSSLCPVYASHPAVINQRQSWILERLEKQWNKFR